MPKAPAQPAQQKTPGIGDCVLVTLDQDVRRPMIVSWSGAVQVGGLAEPTLDTRLCGTIMCQPEDHTLSAFRQMATSQDPARIHGRPERTLPMAYGEYLSEGPGIGQWHRKVQP